LAKWEAQIDLRPSGCSVTVYVASPAPWICRHVPAVVHRRHVGGALHVFQPRLMTQLGARVPAHPAGDAMRALDDGVTDMQP